MQKTWTWFDGLNDLQTTSLLLVVLIGMLAAATSLFAASVELRPRLAAPPALSLQPAVERPLAVERQVDPIAPVSPHTATLLSTANLRAEPTTSARSLATLPQRTELEVLDGDGDVEDVVWRHVRTRDGREGWIIATALD